jgi:hypothetical protein
MAKRNNNMNTRKSKKTMKGGATRKRKLSPALKAWNEKVMRVFREKRKGNPNYRLKDAMKDAKKEG